MLEAEYISWSSTVTRWIPLWSTFRLESSLKFGGGESDLGSITEGVGRPVIVGLTFEVVRLEHAIRRGGRDGRRNAGDTSRITVTDPISSSNEQCRPTHIFTAY